MKTAVSTLRPIAFDLSGCLPLTVKEMEDGQHWVSQGHSWSGISHHNTNLVSFLLLEAMHGTAEAGRLATPERAAFNPLLGVVPKRVTVLTETPLGRLMPLTIDLDHGPNGLELTSNTTGTVHPT